MEDRIDYARVVEMIVYCPNWKEKEQILRRSVKRLIEIETLENMNNQLKESEDEYETVSDKC